MLKTEVIDWCELIGIYLLPFITVEVVLYTITVNLDVCRYWFMEFLLPK